jgi:hypothetical protein
MEARRQGFLKDPALVYDEEHDLFRFRDGKFAFSRKHANRVHSHQGGRILGGWLLSMNPQEQDSLS